MPAGFPTSGQISTIDYGEQRAPLPIHLRPVPVRHRLNLLGGTSFASRFASPSPVSSLGPVRAQLIAKGMILSPCHGDTAFTVPLFDKFMVRIMPGDEWRNG